MTVEVALVRDEVCWEVKVRMGFPIRLSVVTGGVWNLEGFAALWRYFCETKPRLVSWAPSVAVALGNY